MPFCHKKPCNCNFWWEKLLFLHLFSLGRELEARSVERETLPAIGHEHANQNKEVFHLNEVPQERNYQGDFLGPFEGNQILYSLSLFRSGKVLQRDRKVWLKCGFIYVPVPSALSWLGGFWGSELRAHLHTATKMLSSKLHRHFIEKFVHDHEKFDETSMKLLMTAMSMLCVIGPYSSQQKGGSATRIKKIGGRTRKVRIWVNSVFTPHAKCHILLYLTLKKGRECRKFSRKFWNVALPKSAPLLIENFENYKIFQNFQSAVTS